MARKGGGGGLVTMGVWSINRVPPPLFLSEEERTRSTSVKLSLTINSRLVSVFVSLPHRWDPQEASALLQFSVLHERSGLLALEQFYKADFP